MPRQEQPRVTVRNADISFRNFEGREDRYGKFEKKFGIRLTDEFAQTLLKDGWPVKYPTPEEDGEEKSPYIVVHVGYKGGYTPRVAMVTTTDTVDLSEAEVQLMDAADIAKADVIFQMGHWEVNGKTGTKAWLKTFVATIDEDELESEYGLNRRLGQNSEAPAK